MHRDKHRRKRREPRDRALTARIELQRIGALEWCWSILLDSPERGVLTLDALESYSSAQLAKEDAKVWAARSGITVTDFRIRNSAPDL